MANRTISFTEKGLSTVLTFVISTFLGASALAKNPNCGYLGIRSSCQSGQDFTRSQELLARRLTAKSVFQLLNQSPIQVWAAGGDSLLRKTESQLIAQFGGSMQDAVDFIHSLRTKGKIRIGTDNTYYFGDRRRDHVKIGTTKSGRGIYSNWVILTEMPSRNGFGFRVVGSNSYELLGVYVNGKLTSCPGRCPVLNAK